MYQHLNHVKHQTLENQLYLWLEKARGYTAKGRVASYIPALAEANRNCLGIALVDINGSQICAGDWHVHFTLQSISKVIGLAVALMQKGADCVFDRVDMEPTGDPFNSIARLETLQPDKPFNPLINAGAIVVCSMLHGRDSKERLRPILWLISQCIGRTPKVNWEVFGSEWQTADRNRSLAYFLKDMGMLDTGVDEVLELYTMQCAIDLNCLDIAQIAMVLANGGVHPLNGIRVLPFGISRLITTLMFTCGMYNSSGRFAVMVGLPSKSGVSGGILSVCLPGRSWYFPKGCGIGVYSPALDVNGNSLAGMHLLKEMSEGWGLHSF